MKRRVIISFSIIACFAASMSGMDSKNQHKNGFYPTSLADFCTTGKPFGAGVVPYYEDDKGDRFILLGREINSRYKEWAFFSGGSEESNSQKGLMEHPLDCAVREFYEEAIIEKTLGLSESALKEYMKKNTTEVVAEYARDINFKRPLILYFVKFTKEQIVSIVHTFKEVFHDKNLEEKYREKDALAVISYQAFIDTIKNNEWRVPIDKNLPHWFDKDEEDKALIFYMPHQLFRARYATNEIIKYHNNNTLYRYVQDKSCDENLKLFALEWVESTTIKSKL